MSDVRAARDLPAFFPKNFTTHVLRVAVPAPPLAVRLVAAVDGPLVPVDRWTPSPGQLPEAVTARWSTAGGPFAGLGAVCRAAVQRWFGRRLREVLAAALRAAGRWTSGMPRQACGDGALVLPKMRRRLWVRLTRLQMHRSLNRYGQARPGRADRKLTDLQAREVDRLVGEIAVGDWERAFTTTPVRQMLGFLGDFAEADGQLGNIGLLIAGYASHFTCNERTAYRHWKAVRELGLVRQTQHAAYERGARYVLAFPPARIPDGLPADGHPHASQISVRDLPRLDDATQVWDESAAELLAGLDEVELVRYGSARCPNPVTDPPRPARPAGGEHAPTLLPYWCQAFPLYARGETPPPQSGSTSGASPARQRRFRGGISEEERAAALSVLAGCRRRWAQQGLTPPSADDLAAISGLTAIALRHLTPGDLTMLLTEQSRSARDLIGLTRWRLQRCVQDQRRRREVPVDETGDLYAVKAADRAAEAARLYQQSSASRAAVRAALEAVRARKTAAQTEADTDTARRPTPPTKPEAQLVAEPEAVFAAELTTRGLAAADASSAAELAALRQAMANAQVAQHRRQPPPVADVLRRLRLRPASAQKRG